MLLLLSALVEHLLEELELGICACDEEERRGEDGDNSRHLVNDYVCFAAKLAESINRARETLKQRISIFWALRSTIGK